MFLLLCISNAVDVQAAKRLRWPHNAKESMLPFFSPLCSAAQFGPASSALQSQQSQRFPAAAAASAPPAAATVEAAAPAAPATAPSAVAVPTARPAGAGTASRRRRHHPVLDADAERRQAAGSHRA